MGGEREAEERKTERRQVKESGIIDGKPQMETGGEAMQIPGKKAQQKAKEVK